MQKKVWFGLSLMGRVCEMWYVKQDKNKQVSSNKKGSPVYNKSLWWVRCVECGTLNSIKTYMTKKGASVYNNTKAAGATTHS